MMKTNCIKVTAYLDNNNVFEQYYIGYDIMQYNVLAIFRDKFTKYSNCIIVAEDIDMEEISIDDLKSQNKINYII